MRKYLYLVLASLALSSQALEPLIAEKGKLVYERDFEDDKPLDPKKWKPVQKTTWQIENGKVVGRPTSDDVRKKIAEEQKAQGNKKAGRSHNGQYPRLNFYKTPDHTIIEMKVKFTGGQDLNNSYCRMIELGTHNARINFKLDKTIMYANINTETLDEDPWILAKDTFCTFLMEIKGKEFCLQVENGPTLKGSSDSFLTKPRRGKINLVGNKGSTVYIDYIKIWEAK